MTAYGTAHALALFSNGDREAVFRADLIDAGRGAIVCRVGPPADLGTDRDQQGGEGAEGERPSKAARSDDHPIDP